MKRVIKCLILITSLSLLGCTSNANYQKPPNLHPIKGGHYSVKPADYDDSFYYTQEYSNDVNISF